MVVVVVVLQRFDDIWVMNEQQCVEVATRTLQADKVGMLLVVVVVVVVVWWWSC